MLRCYFSFLLYYFFLACFLPPLKCVFSPLAYPYLFLAYHPWLLSYHLWNMSTALGCWLFPFEICLSLCFRLPIHSTDIIVSSPDNCVCLPDIMFTFLRPVACHPWDICSFLTYRPIFLRSCASLPCHLSLLTCFHVTGLSYSHAWFSLVCRLSPLTGLLFPAI